ncbi:MAG: hypothetical protein AAGI91_01830 [Bacteroidota bacterium]
MAEPTRFLLDTRVLLWSLDAPERLSDDTREAIQGARHAVFVSTASRSGYGYTQI